MYKDLSLKEKAKVIREGVRLGLNSIDDILSLYDEAIGHKFLGDIKSQMNISKKEPIKQRLDFKANIGTKILSLPRLLMKGFDDPVAHEDLGRYYFGLPLKDNYLEYSKYKPQKSKNKNSTYIAINDPYFQEELINGYYSNTGWVDKLNGIKNGYEMPSDIELIIRVREGKQKVTPYDLGRFTLTSGIDPNRGQYISYYDIWDASGNINRPNLNKPEWYRLWGTKPFEVYDRIYLDDYYGVNSTPQEGTYYGGWIAPVTVTPNEYKSGGPIVSPYGQWLFNGKKKKEDTIIPSNNITMDNVNYPVLGISDTGDAKIMMPWNDYKFRGSMVYEHPLIGHLALDGKKFNRLLKLSNWYHRNADNIPKFIHRGIYNTIKDSAFTDEPLSEMKYNLLPNLIHNRAGAYDNAFLMSPKQLEEYLRSIGYNKVEDENYGLVNKAVLNYKNATGREVPIFQYGKDDANRSELIPLKNNIYGAFRPQEGFEDKDHLGDIGAAPYRLYRDKDGNLFYKRWDFFDHGDYSRNSYSASDDEYVVPALTTNSLRYGNILDNMGNPYVKTTGYTRISDPIEINHALNTIEGIPILFDDLYKLYLDSLKSGRYDYLKGGNLFLGDNSKINKLNKRMHYSGGTGKFWGAVANNLFSKEDNYYNGTHYSGLYLSGRQEDLPQGRDHINLYTLGDETGFTRIDNATPITVNGNVYDYNLYEGKILPLDTIYLNPISQLPIDSMIEHKNLLGLDTDYFLMNKSYKQDYPKQYNNTWGYPNVHKGVVLDDTRKVSVSPKKDEKGDYYLDVFDIIDYGGTVGIGGNYIDNIVEKNGSGGPYILRLKVPVVFDAKKQSNGPLLNQLSSGNSTNTWEDYLMKYSPSYNAIVGNKVLPIEVIHTRSYGGNLFKKGGIYINPKNKGKFNATKKRTGKTTEELTHSKNPLTRKRAIFALNAKKWHHKRDEGGYLYSEGGFLLAPYLYVE